MHGLANVKYCRLEMMIQTTRLQLNRKCFILKLSFFSQILHLLLIIIRMGRSQWPRGLRRRSAAARLLRSWVQIPPGAWMFVCCECCVLSGRGLCDELITCPEESYWLWCVVVCDLETSRMRRPWPAFGTTLIILKLRLQEYLSRRSSCRLDSVCRSRVYPQTNFGEWIRC